MNCLYRQAFCISTHSPQAIFCYAEDVDTKVSNITKPGRLEGKNKFPTYLPTTRFYIFTENE